MKRLAIISILFFTLLAASCVRSGEETTKSQLVGEWNWVQSSGGIAGQTVTPDSPGHSPYSITFTGDNQFYLHRGDSLAQQGRYTLSLTRDAAMLHYKLSTQSDKISQQVRFNTSDTLLLTDECTDCYRNIYIRVN